MRKRVSVAICAALQNAGEVTRALELAKGIRAFCPPDREVTVTFLSHGSRFEPVITSAGFEILRCEPAMRGPNITDDLRFDPPELVGSVEIGRSFLKGQRHALSVLKPDVVLHGIWLFGNLAARLLGLPTIAYLPVPRELIVDGLRRSPHGLPPQQRLSKAAVECGWRGDPPVHMFDMLRADHTIINDLPMFYAGKDLGPALEVTGPLFAPDQPDAVLEPALLKVLSPEDPRPTILLTMASSGIRSAFLEGVRAIAGPGSDRWKCVILATPEVCPPEDAIAVARNDPGVYITDRFLPANAISARVDLVVSHGGQGTIQTALAAGTPLVGVAMQMEQKINLQHVASAGAGIRVPFQNWNAATIQDSVRTVLRDSRYPQKAKEISEQIRAMDGRRLAATAIWRRIELL